MDFLAQELLEFSIVPVPANAEALLDAKAAGIDCTELKSWAEQILDGLTPGLWVPKAQALAVFKALAEPSVAVHFTQEEVAKAHFAAVEKRGRVLSSENLAHVTNAHKSAAVITDCLQKVLDACDPVNDLPMEESAAVEPPTTKAAPALVLAEKKRPTALAISREDVTAAVKAAVQQVAQSAVNRAAGRLD